MAIREASIDDASSLAALSIEVWIGTYLRNGVSKFFADYALSTFTTQIFEAFIDDENEIVLVSDNSDGIDGFVRVTLESPAPIENGPETEIATLYVQPRHKGKGIGKRLLEEVSRLCIERQCDGVWLTVNSENQDAIAFYQRLGFTRDGQTAFRIGEQSYANAVMVKRL
ncbi:N-acetyltransferase [Rhizobium rhizogenes]|uniref:GNAT family N-acetyltransferase n=1 Tax=Rhizobium rhizogenes TaxID=359 RepID=A0AA92HB27_RHIRH|nr:GNAT family N-acetyltransferase [Rhizobium rhizogenes]PVE57020.1 GNAT family N-acetyltransferase [Rhizobium rhizogenes]PVE68468.1 GNAT family N-acetyltransferase [Agrobacterium tumefaciens]PVE78216.1 GNAT family N-acetyltransferase [Sphingomonas sp. TPD3009]